MANNPIHGKNVYFTLEDSTGASANFSGDGNQSEISETVKNPESTAYGNNSVQRAGSGLNDMKMTFSGWASKSAGSGNMVFFTLMKGQQRVMVWGPNGSSSSNIKYTACVLVDDWAVSAPVDNLVTAKGSFSLASGSLTTTCFP